MKQAPIPADITFVDFKCPHCENGVSFPDQVIGRPQECPTCSQILIVPKPGEEYGAKLPVPFQTPRLLLRRLTMDDANDLLEIVGDVEVARNYEWYPMDEHEVQFWLATDLKKPLFQREGLSYLALELLGEPKVIGFATMAYTDNEYSEMTADVCVNSNYQRRGIGTEAFRGVMQLIFVGLNVRRLCTGCSSKNHAGVCVLENSKLRREGEFLKSKFVKGKWTNTVQFALLQEEYVSMA